MLLKSTSLFFLKQKEIFNVAVWKILCQSDLMQVALQGNIVIHHIHWTASHISQGILGSFCSTHSPFLT